MASGREGGRVHLASEAGLADGVRLVLALQQVLETHSHVAVEQLLDVCIVVVAEATM